MIVTHSHAAMLINQLRGIVKEIEALPTNDIADDTRYPNKSQQRLLLARAGTDATHAIWALEEYNNGIERDGYLKTRAAASAQ